MLNKDEQCCKVRNNELEHFCTMPGINPRPIRTPQKARFRQYAEKEIRRTNITGVQPT